MRPLAVALGTLLQARGRAAQQQAEHAPGIRVERVGRARAPLAQVLEGPRADERLGVALLLHPADRGGLLVAEATLDRGVDLDRALTTDVSHGGEPTRGPHGLGQAATGCVLSVFRRASSTTAPSDDIVTAASTPALHE